MMISKSRTYQALGLGTLFIIFFFLPLLAKDFWEEKAFTQWNEKEAQKILSDSPWGKTQTIALMESGSEFGEGRGIPGRPNVERGPGGTGGGYDSPGGPVGPGETAPRGPGGFGGDRTEPGAFGRSFPFRIVWYSSVRIRQAMGRLGQLRGNASEEQAKQLAQQPMEDYVIALSGPIMKPFEQASLESLKNKTFLLSKKVKQKKIELKEYMSPRDRKDGMALFVFPRTIDGKPSMDMADEEAQFVTEQGPLRIKASFKLAKMLTDGKLDL